jgi:hypothetical protein
MHSFREVQDVSWQRSLLCEQPQHKALGLHSLHVCRTAVQ